MSERRQNVRSTEQAATGEMDQPWEPVEDCERLREALEAIRDYDGVAPITSMRRIAKEALGA